jgi:hypothetical protein
LLHQLQQRKERREERDGSRRSFCTLIGKKRVGRKSKGKQRCTKKTEKGRERD